MRVRLLLGLIWEGAGSPQEIQHWGVNTFSEFTTVLIYMPEIQVLVNVLPPSEVQCLMWLKNSYLGWKAHESAFPYSLDTFFLLRVYIHGTATEAPLTAN